MTDPTAVTASPLGHVQEAFELWRSTRHGRTRTPADLQRQAVALLQSYRAAHICTALRLNHQVLMRWAAAFQNLPARTHAAKGFVELAPCPAPLCDHLQSTDHALRIAMELGNGLQLTVSGTMSLSDIVQVASQFKGESR